MTARVYKIRRAPDARETEWSDQAVAHACASRDPIAVSELFNRFHAGVTRYLSRVIGATEDVEDLVQMTFMEVARGKAHYDGRSAVTTWLLGIATNVAKHYLRSRSRRSRLLRTVKEAAPSQLLVGVAEVIDARRLLEQINDLLQRQSPDRRLAFALCELEGLSARDAARILNTTETAVWKRVSEVRHALRALVPERGP